MIFSKEQADRIIRTQWILGSTTVFVGIMTIAAIVGVGLLQYCNPGG